MTSDLHIHPSGEGHTLSMGCWCHPYRLPADPRLVIHRKVARA